MNLSRRHLFALLSSAAVAPLIPRSAITMTPWQIANSLTVPNEIYNTVESCPPWTSMPTQYGLIWGYHSIYSRREDDGWVEIFAHPLREVRFKGAYLNE